VVDAPGDNVLAEFGSVVDAVECAVEIQKELKTRNTDLPENRRMEFRIGVNLGDVIEDGEQILGDGVNIAARLESLSEAGGICISGTAYDHVENKLSLGYQYLGEQTVKNIAKPVRVYRVLMEPEAVGKVLGEKKTKPRQWQKTAFIVVSVLILVIAAVVIWSLYFRPSPPKVEVASKEKMAYPLPDKPSIAVLPFVNMSGDPKQEFLCDGMTEGIITVLSKVPRLFVVARDSTFTYKGKPVKVKQVSEDLGVRYVLEGSVQRSGDRVRITAQLIDALTGDHLWAERYDRDLKDLFALQDDVTLKVLTAIRVKLTEGELSLGYGKYYRGKEGLDCYLKIMEGNDLVSRRNIRDNNLARRIAEEALAMCPEVPTAYLLMANVHSLDYWLGSTRSPRGSLDKAIELVQKALALDDTTAEAHGFLGYLYTQKKEYEKGIAQGERAVALNPGDPTVLTYYAMSLNFAGRSEEAITLLQKAIRLNPVGSYYNHLSNHQFGNALLYTGRYEEAVSAYKKAIQRAPNYMWSHLMLAATYSMMGREKEAQAEAAEVLRINPKFSLDFFAKTTPLKDQSVKDNIINAFRKAGLK
jgi:adenylate cyclase